MRQQHRAGVGGSRHCCGPARCGAFWPQRYNAPQMRHAGHNSARLFTGLGLTLLSVPATCCLCSFPMGFVSDRLYAGISRQEFTDPSDPGCFYTVSKVVHTPTTAAWAALNYPGAHV